MSARHARAGERLRLIDGSELSLDAGALVIADAESAVGLAGVMGGEHSAISAASTDIVFEAAWFKPAAIAGRARLHGLQTEASQRFERGVDWRGQERAMALATQLLLEIAGGKAGPVTTAELTDELPRIRPVQLRSRQLQRLLGANVAAADVERRLRALGMGVRPEQAGWSVQPPSWRFDIEIEPDLIEEVVRIGGLDSIEERAPVMTIVPRSPAGGELDERARHAHAGGARLPGGHHLRLRRSGTAAAAVRRERGRTGGLELANPIAADLSVMRGSLLPGLIGVARENLRRQQQRVRVFEIASRFVSAAGEAGTFREQKMLAALALGSRLPEQWGAAATPADFYDLKGDLSALLALGGTGGEFLFEPAAPGYLHPGRAARILRDGFEIGCLGELHPRLVRELELTYAPLLFEVDYLGAFRANLAQFREVSRFPHIRRDISFTVPVDVAFATLERTC